MNTKEHYIRIMENHTEMAIATSTYSQPNVRIVNYYYDRADNKIYFITIERNNKIREFDINPKIAFTTIPNSGYEHIRAKGMVRKSKKSFAEIENDFRKKVPEIEEVLRLCSDYVNVFEIECERVTVSINFEKSGILEINW